MPIIVLRINNIYGPNQWDVKVSYNNIQLAVNELISRLHFFFFFLK